MMVKRVIYPGTFDPITNGHLDILGRALTLFDKVEVVVAENPQKNPLFSLKERMNLIKNATKGWKGVSVSACRGLLVDCLKKGEKAIFIRGLRAVSDFQYEIQLAVMNRKLNTDIETVFLTPNESYIFLSSSMVRNIVRFKGDITRFVPAAVGRALKEKFHL